MTDRQRVTVTLSQPVLTWLKAQVNQGKEASIGWVIDRIAYEQMQKDENGQADAERMPFMTEAQQQTLFEEIERRLGHLLCVRRIRNRSPKKKAVEG